MNLPTDAELIRAAKQRTGTDAYAVLVRRYERLVWTVAWQILRDYHATQDVTQETFLKAHERLSELRSADSIGSWLATIARRQALRVASSDAKTHTSELRDVIDDNKATTLDEYEPLLNAISRLPDHERDVTSLRYLNGHSVAEVAQLLDRPVGTVTKQLSRAIKRLSADLQSDSPDTISKQEQRSSL